MARLLGGVRRRGSGNQENRRGDVTLGDAWLGEVKRSSARKGKSITITVAAMDKIEREAEQAHRLPFLLAEVQTATQRDGRRYIVLPLWLVQNLGLLR